MEESEVKQITERLEQEKETYNQIAARLADHYDALYYIDLETDHFIEFSTSGSYRDMKVPVKGEDFFAETRENIAKYVHPDDRDKVIDIHRKDVILKNMETRFSYSVKYRWEINGAVKYIRNKMILSDDRRHLIVCLENIDDEVRAEQMLEESRRRSDICGQIAMSLAEQYDTIYYVELVNGTFAEFIADEDGGGFEIREDDGDFFETAAVNIDKSIHPEDRDRVKKVIDRDFLKTVLGGRKQFSINYRLIVDGREQYSRLTITWSVDKSHLIMAAKNVDHEIRKENDNEAALKSANEMARRDELTGVSNANAYKELEDAFQSNIDKGLNVPFAIIVCDLNDLKSINDTQGHNTGNDYLRESVSLISEHFPESPVFRVGGDEFTVVLTGREYDNREELFKGLRKHILDNIATKEGPVIATGLAVYDSRTHRKFSDVFGSADKNMYENKKNLKA